MEQKQTSIAPTSQPLLDNRGRTVASTPEGIESFRRWFGSSKVVDPDTGLPLLMFHGTQSDVRQRVVVNGVRDQSDDAGIRQFHMWSHFGSIHTASQFATGPEGAHIYPVYLSIENPLRIIDSGMQHTSEDLIAAARKGLAALGIDQVEIPLRTMLEKHGFDGLVYENLYEGGGDCYIPLRKSQIKSATGNQGLFSKESLDIVDGVKSLVGEKIDLARLVIARFLEVEASVNDARSQSRPGIR
jgi:hypothetical protein